MVRFFGAYEIREELGSGGMGVVYKARHLKLKKFVALKMIRAGAFASELEVKMFEAEAQAAAKLDHAGIVAVHEVGMHAGQHFYAMDYVAGGSLSVLHRDEPVPARRTAELVRQLADAVQYAHEQGIVHRDLKPANILLTTKGEPRISDFGLAKRMWIGDDSVAVNMTETGKILGTPGYMSPEQAEGKTNLVAAPADIYALGAVLYALLTSRAPFVGESHVHIIQQVTRNEPVSPRMLNPNVPRDLETICLKCLNKEPHGRYGTAQLLADDLQRFLEGRPVLARPISRPARVWRWCRRNPWVSGLATAVVASLVIGSIVSTGLGMAAHRNSIESEKRGAALAVSLEDSQNKLAEIVKLTKERSEALEESRWQVYRFRLMRMEQLWQQKNWGHLERLLDESVPAPGEKDLRGWEWHYLKAQLDRRVWRIHETPEKSVVGLDWSGNMGKLAVLRPGMIEIWLPRERRLVKSIAVTATTYNPGRIRWSPDQRHLAVVRPDHKVVVIDSETGDIVSTTGEPLQPPTGHHFIEYIDWSPRGDCLAVSFRHSGIQLWKMGPEPVLIKSLETYEGFTPRWIHWNPDQTMCAAISSYGRAMYWNTSDWSLLRETEQLATNWCDDVAWSPDGLQVAIASYTGLAAGTEGEQLKSLANQSARIMAVRWLDNERLVTANNAQELRIVRVDQKAPDAVFHMHPQLISGLSVGPDDQISLVVQGSSVKVWSPGDIVPEYITLAGARLPRQSVTTVWHPQSTVLALVSQEQSGNVAATWTPGAEELETIPFTAGAVSVCWSPLGDAVVIETKNNRSNTLPWPASESIRPTATVQHNGLRYSCGGRFRVDAQLNTQQITIVDTHDPTSMIIPNVNTLYAFAWNPREDLLAIAQHDFVTLCDPQREKSCWVSTPWNSQFGVTDCLAWNHSGRQLFIGGQSGLIHVLDGATLNIVHILRGHAGAITAVGCSNDGNRIVSAGLDGFLRWWDATKGVELFKMPVASSESLCELRFSSDGRWLAGRAESGKIYIWTTTSQAVFGNVAPAPIKTRSLDELTASTDAQPNTIEARLRRAERYRQKHMWAEALADLEIALDGVAGAHYLHRSTLAALHLRRGNIDAFRKICGELIAESTAAPDDDRLADIIRLACLSPVAVEDYAPIMEISNTLLSKRGDVFFHRNRISVLCRLKRWDEAVEAARAFRTKYEGGLEMAQPMLFESIALQNLGETDAARELLINAKQYAEAQTPNPRNPVGWFSLDAIYTEILFAEASELILGERQDLSLKYPAADLEAPK